MASLRAVVVSFGADGTITAIRFVETDYRHLSTVNESIGLALPNKKKELVQSAKFDVLVPDPEWFECWRTSQAATLQPYQPFDSQYTESADVGENSHLLSQTKAMDAIRQSPGALVPEGVL